MSIQYVNIVNFCFPFQFKELKKETEKITKRNFRPNSIEQFEHLYNVLGKHGKDDNVWKSFSLLLECHNHFKNANTGEKKVRQRLDVI